MTTILLFLAFGSPHTAFADATTSMIALPAGFTSDLTAAANQQISNFSPLLLLILGLLLALVAVGALISFLTRGHK